MTTAVVPRTRQQIEDEIGHLRLKQLAAVIPSTAGEIQVEIDAQIDAWIKADG